MKKLLQENGPSQVWVQTWISDGGDAYSVAEPAAMTDLDDWTGQLYNYYFLSAFQAESEGSLDANHDFYPTLKKLLDAYFAEGGLAGLHQNLTSKWAEVSPLCDDDAYWFTAAWDQFVMDDYSGRAIGFYFSRERKNFLNMHGDEPLLLRGLPMQKPEYACFIIPDATDGFTIYTSVPGTDMLGVEAWSNKLFPFIRVESDAFHSKQFFKMCKAFSEDVLVKEQNQPRERQLGFLAESLDYTANKREVNFENFKAEVLKEPTIIDAFDTFQEKYTEERKWNPPDQFAVTEQAQNQARKFVKSVIKLDKNFHIYVHGNKERIEKGFDPEKKLNFYTLWFDAEA